ncbi:MAG: ClbS/DfsB family four-helix bundle protein [Pelagimonas sp.]|jgi:hypothetical protein|nr:ClbS/DfsB family four-helix bundle protein [Pelagimonas sp.]
MPAATCKSDLLAVSDKEFGKLSKLLANLPEQVRMTPDDAADGTTLKDIVGHRAAWIDLFLGWYALGQTGADVPMPAPGYKWNELRRFNADLRAKQADLDWPSVNEMLVENHAKLMSFLQGLDEDALYGGPMQGGRNTWTTGRWAEAAGPSHYRSAAKYIRARLRDLQSSD